MSPPLVTIAVPTRNRAAVLRQTLPNICGQDYPNLEILISDNGSTDTTEEMCRAAAREDGRIRYVRQPGNIGLHGNHNFCMDEARGEFLCFFHDHDHRSLQFVSKLVAFMLTHPRVGLAGTDWELIDDNDGRVGTRQFAGPAVEDGVAYTARTIRSARSSVGIPGGMIRVEALGAARFGLEAPIGFGDFPIWFRIAEDWSVGHLHEPLSSWRQNRESLSLRPIVDIVRDYQTNITAYLDDRLGRRPADAPLVAGWRDSLRRFVFWALAYEVALHYRRRGRGREAIREPGTSFELLDYDLTPEQFARALAEMRARRRAPLEYGALAGIQALIRTGLTSPFRFVVRHQAALRALMGLR